MARTIYAHNCHIENTTLIYVFDDGEMFSDHRSNEA